MPDATALIIVDVQRDFLPGGALAVPDGDEVIAPLVEAADRADLVIATRDWHPEDHESFTKHGGEWPVHCVRFTDGAALDDRIEGVAHAVVNKGEARHDDGYSAFSGTWSSQSSTLDTFLRDCGVGKVLIGGLATDFCVRATAEDARRLGYEVELVEAGCRGIDPAASEAVLAEFRG